MSFSVLLFNREGLKSNEPWLISTTLLPILGYDSWIGLALNLVFTRVLRDRNKDPKIRTKSQWFLKFYLNVCLYYSAKFSTYQVFLSLKNFFITNSTSLTSSLDKTASWNKTNFKKWSKHWLEGLDSRNSNPYQDHQEQGYSLRGPLAARRLCTAHWYILKITVKISFCKILLTQFFDQLLVFLFIVDDYKDL